jgi:hypothetical protein
MLTTTDQIALMTVRDDRDQPVRVDTLWKTRPCVLVFVRQFG